MPSAAVLDLNTVHVAQSATVRLVASARLKEPALAPLADRDDELDDLVRLEYATHGRLAAEQRGLPDLHPRELAAGVPHAAFINAAFTYTRPGGNRFNDTDRGAWYCAFEVETSLAEVAWHLTRFLADTGTYENTTNYAEMLADFIGAFHDLRGITPPHACLDPDTAVGYPEGQRLARRLRAEGSKGLVYPSVRCPAGTCLVVFHPASVQNVRQGALWRLTWAGTPEPAVARV